VKILVLGNEQRPGVREEVARWLPFLQQNADVVAVDLCQEQKLDAPACADLALVFGGDGAILRAARQMGYRQVPVLGINLGRLGFLADIHPQEFHNCFAKVLEGQYRVTRHLMYECVVADGGKSRTFLGLNEVVVQTPPPLHMLDLEVEADGMPVARFSGDGLIISTPVGSTAHNLSAGGPILEQELAAFVLTPICPHSLTLRPVVDTADRIYTIHLGRDMEDALVIMDGQESVALRSGERVLIRKAPVSFGLVKMQDRTFFQTLREKLRWGTAPNYRGEP
jgi:NAD+ kinase